ncbi:methyltransferase [Ameyamaea chiangmaiensis NBRC 103196]|uniref:Ribosomal RNA methyltransferase FtsJ domain-containing protein n=1 Tax=Ameyamaea chiangmaiensis TaxID=442969 RepID=A0A850P9I8_9PROT|nr:SAM-dependent methyltransferase [Ameyamaea chiangmaiensis]MBS4074281.1 hypothetical protein [Ameyamaea chiangmaiensis]NVN40568.1 hypothetical protein [Ameyamaea chiangmaiensis]GBQ71490.1 methyltransferase [Ameyamaea chiangmaiensis NBRC 103196]
MTQTYQHNAGEVRAAYLAPEGLEAVLEAELARAGVPVTAWHGRLALSGLPPIDARWALDIWTDPVVQTVTSIGDAARQLRDVQRNWGLYAPSLHRRCALIAERLPRLVPRPLVFPAACPTGHLGAWTLLDNDTLLLSPTKTSAFVNGDVPFVEDRVGPPSRAYLKLWEALTLFGRHPTAAETCLDLGAAPGGWTWVLAQCGAKVIAFDRAPLDPALMTHPRVEWRQESAFGLDPQSLPPVDWLCSDIIAYPPRLLALTQRWIASGRVRFIVLTIKFQGETDFDTADAFAAIPGSRVVHLSHNKHELTFLWSADA